MWKTATLKLLHHASFLGRILTSSWATFVTVHVCQVPLKASSTSSSRLSTPLAYPSPRYTPRSRFMSSRSSSRGPCSCWRGLWSSVCSTSSGLPWGQGVKPHSPGSSQHQVQNRVELQGPNSSEHSRLVGLLRQAFYD